jgi:hypothetical protein
MYAKSQVSVDDLYFLLGLKRRDIMANLWTIAFDDSGDERKAVFIIAGCLVGNKAEWNDFNKAWRKGLHRSPRIEHFHQKEYASRNEEFRQFFDKTKWPEPSGKEAARDKRDALLSVIAKSRLSCYALALRVPDYVRVRNASRSCFITF